MARKQRVHYYGALYHVIARGNNKEIIFKDDADKKKYLELLMVYKKKYDFSLYAYVLMDNHFHLLIEVKEAPLSQIMQGLQLSYTQYFNKKYARVGHVFQQRYKAEICERDQYMLMLIKYIHENPARAGIGNVSEYHWSSHKDYLRPSDPLVDTSFPLSIFAAERKTAIHRYLEFMQTANETQLDEIQEEKIMMAKVGKPLEARHIKLEIEDIAKFVIEKIGVQREEIFMRTRQKKNVEARRLIIYLLLKLQIASRSEIANYLGISQSNVTRAFNFYLDDKEDMAFGERMLEELKSYALMQA